MNMQKAYIAVSYQQKEMLAKELGAIRDVLLRHSIRPLVFVDEYAFAPADDRKMMTQVMQELDGSTLLIAEVSDKAIGIGIEIGYAKAKGLPVIYLRNIGAEHSTTVAGISDHRILYVDANDLDEQLDHLLQKTMHPRH